MVTDKHKKLAQWAMEFALKNGCQACRTIISGSVQDSFNIRDMKIDKLQQATSNSLTINLFVDGKYGSFWTNRMDQKEIQNLIINGIESTRYLAEDLARTLPDPSLYYKGGQPDLQVCDDNFENVSTDTKLTLAKQVCDEIMGKDSRIISSTSGFQDSRSSSYMITSNGFEGSRSNTSFSLYGSVSVKGDGDARPSDSWGESSMFFNELKTDGIGAKTLERTLRKLGQRKVASGKMPMLLDWSVSASAFDPLISALLGSAIQQQRSFLVDKLEEKLFSSKLNLFDEPHMTRARGAKYYDSEGVATKKRSIIENGVLKTYFINTYYANKLGMANTIESPSLLTIQLGNKNVDQLIETVDKGIFVTGFNGGNSNETTGDFSFGIEGFLIEKGKLTQPVNEMNITGNFITLLNNLAEIGNDPDITSSWRIPSLLFDGVSFSGL